MNCLLKNNWQSGLFELNELKVESVLSCGRYCCDELIRTFGRSVMY